jgi:threonine/homoserine/homoserine lactone efflux protein
MPDATQMLAFFLAAIVLAAIPGPGLLYVLARSLGGGRDVGLRSSLGTGLGGCVHVRMLIEGREPSLRGLGGRGADVGAFRQGVITEALNPKTALFFVSFLPGSLGQRRDRWPCGWRCWAASASR